MRPTVLAVIDLKETDAAVVDATRTAAAANGARIVLLHVARPVSLQSTPNSRREQACWGRMAAADEAAQRVLRRLATRRLPRDGDVQTGVRFGDAVEQVGQTVISVDATLVVAAAGPARWLWGRSRDRRLRRSLDVPVVLVPGRGATVDGSCTARPESSRASRQRPAA
jgi:Universal stress protein family